MTGLIVFDNFNSLDNATVNSSVLKRWICFGSDGFSSSESFGALTSSGFMGLLVLIESFGIELPSYLPIVVTLFFVRFTFRKLPRILAKYSTPKK